MKLIIENLTKKYGEKVALREFSYTFTPTILPLLVCSALFFPRS